MAKRWRYLVPLIVSAMIAPWANALAQNPDENLGKEIKRVRKELLQVQEEQGRTKEQREKDAKEFEEYRKRTLKRLREVRQQTDSIKQEILIYKGQNDSLSALVEAERGKKRRYEILQESLRTDLAGLCTRLADYAKTLPPTTASRSVSALKLLSNDLNAKGVENVEALNRMSQILTDLHENTAVIQIVQGSSPIPEIRGTTYRLRIGTVFEAVVNANKTKAALWTGYDKNGTPKWHIISDVAVADRILEAVNIREGKSLPKLVALPMSHLAVSRSDGNAEKAQGEQ